MKMSDIITARILNMLEQSELNTAEIQRNELAALLGCVPSQINYVLSSRFTPEHGYVIESRRGGGGFIKITRVSLDRSSALMHIINSVGNTLDPSSARILIENSRQGELITEEAAYLMQAAISNTVLRQIPPEYREYYRAAVIKQMLLAQI
jgi:transcriptional regulator CtsR